MIRLLIADDHRLFREGLKQILLEIFNEAVIDEASNGQEVLEKVAANCYDVILLDISMPGRSGLDILKQLKSDNWNVHVLIISMHSEEEYAERALRAGAFGYITKDCSPDELSSAIRKIAAGKKYVSSALAERLAWHLDAKSDKLFHEALSDREYEIMCMIASGKTLTNIAEELSLSIKTISTHRKHVLIKMNMENNSQLTHYAIQNQLVV